MCIVGSTYNTIWHDNIFPRIIIEYPFSPFLETADDDVDEPIDDDTLDDPTQAKQRNHPHHQAPPPPNLRLPVLGLQVKGLNPFDLGARYTRTTQPRSITVGVGVYVVEKEEGRVMFGEGGGVSRVILGGGGGVVRDMLSEGWGVAKFLF